MLANYHTMDTPHLLPLPSIYYEGSFTTAEHPNDDNPSMEPLNTQPFNGAATTNEWVDK